jgi:hypothetical protein
MLDSRCTLSSTRASGSRSDIFDISVIALDDVKLREWLGGHLLPKFHRSVHRLGSWPITWPDPLRRLVFSEIRREVKC